MLQSAYLQNLTIFGHWEEGLFNLQSCAFLCHSKIHEKEKFSTGPTCHPPSAPWLLTLAALRYFPLPHVRATAPCLILCTVSRSKVYFSLPAAPLFAERSSPHCSQLPPSVARCSAMPPHCLHHFSLLLLLFALPCCCCCGLTAARFCCCCLRAWLAAGRCYCGCREPRRSSHLMRAPSDLIVSSPPQAGAHHQPCSASPPDARHWHRLSVPCSGQLHLMLLSLERCPASSFPSHRDVCTPLHCW
jgi:hypothetical protein